MTFLEVILAVVLIGLLASTIAMLTGSLQRSQQRHKDLLATHELANALILQYVDDPNSVPSSSEPVAYNDAKYRFTFKETRARIALDAAAFGDDQASRRERNVDRVKQISVTVWPSEDFGGSARFDQSLPHASLTRLVDPLSFANPDSANTRLNTEEGMTGVLQELMSLDGGGPAGDDEDQ
ncbi:MAG: hypothetical protein DHS20C14_11910 [Phycisphaeraceae bacterium]|nr:MAG: hypothetical protein DHS20C14_11910 [Phycisphaeraceae bacterium]